MLTQELKLLLSQLALDKKNLLIGCGFSSEDTIAHTIDIYTQGKRSRTRFCHLFSVFCLHYSCYEAKEKRKCLKPTQPSPIDIILKSERESEETAAKQRYSNKVRHIKDSK
jgi:hypothetical protein